MDGYLVIFLFSLIQSKQLIFRRHFILCLLFNLTAINFPDFLISWMHSYKGFQSLTFLQKFILDFFSSHKNKSIVTNITIIYNNITLPWVILWVGCLTIILCRLWHLWQLALNLGCHLWHLPLTWHCHLTSNLCIYLRNELRLTIIHLKM